MLILFDHGTPQGLIRALPQHTVHTAQAKGGALLNAAEEAGYEVLLTTDRRIRYGKKTAPDDLRIELVVKAATAAQVPQSTTVAMRCFGCRRLTALPVPST